MKYDNRVFLLRQRVNYHDMLIKLNKIVDFITFEYLNYELSL